MSMPMITKKEESTKTRSTETRKTIFSILWVLITYFYDFTRDYYIPAALILLPFDDCSGKTLYCTRADIDINSQSFCHTACNHDMVRKARQPLDGSHELGVGLRSRGTNGRMERYRIVEGVGVYYVTFTVVEWLPVFIDETACESRAK